jgi:hypothetical protein
MNRMQEAKMVPPIFIGRWTPKVLQQAKASPPRKKKGLRVRFLPDQELG